MIKFTVVGSAIIATIAKFFQNKVVKTATTVALLTTFISIIPFDLAFSDDFVGLFEKGGDIYNIFNGLNYFVPISYLFKCFLLVFLLHYTKFFWHLFYMIYDFFKN